MWLVRLSAERKRGFDVIHRQLVLSHGPSLRLGTLRVVFRQTSDERSSHGRGFERERVGIGSEGVFVVGGLERRHE